MMAYVAEDLAYDKNQKKNQAKGIMTKHNLQDYVVPEILNKLNAFVYKEDTDDSICRRVD